MGKLPNVKLQKLVVQTLRAVEYLMYLSKDNYAIVFLFAKDFRNELINDFRVFENRRLVRLGLPPGTFHKNLTTNDKLRKQYEKMINLPIAKSLFKKEFRMIKHYILIRYCLSKNMIKI